MLALGSREGKITGPGSQEGREKEAEERQRVATADGNTRVW